MRLRWSMGLAVALFTSVLFGGENLVEFSDESLRSRYQTLITELRCPKCQNQNLADSNAPISQDLREEIQRMLEQQMSNREIKQHLTSRYSDFILYRPDVNKTTYLLWGSPLAILMIGLLIAVRLNRRNKIHAGSLDKTAVDQESRIAELLKSGEDDK